MSAVQFFLLASLIFAARNCSDRVSGILQLAFLISAVLSFLKAFA